MRCFEMRYIKEREKKKKRNKICITMKLIYFHKDIINIIIYGD